MKKLVDVFKVKSQAYFSTNIMFVVFVGVNLLNALLLRIFTVQNYFAVKPIIADLAVLLIIGSFSYMLKAKKQIFYFLSWTIIFTAICIINSAYYTFYMSFASISLLSTSVFVIDVGDAVVEQVLEYKEFIYLYAPIVILLSHFILKKKNYYNVIEKIEKRKKMLTMTLIVSGILISIFVVSLTSLEASRLYKQWNREYIVGKFGLYTYQINDLVQSLEPKISILFGYDKAVKSFRDYYNSKSTEIIQNKYTDIFEGKNVIVIHAESIQQIAMDLKFENQEVTPVLNKLAKEGIFFNNFYSQVSVGTSSDAEFTFNTGLLPVSNGTVFISYADREFITNINLLKEKNYYTYCMHGNNAGFWNRNVMYKQIGYDDFISKGDYDISDETKLGLGISDLEFFTQSVEKMTEIKSNLDENQPFYSTLITLTNHTPWSETDKYGEFPVTKTINIDGAETTTPYLEGTTLGNYFKSTHYSDYTIGVFIDLLEEAGLLENTILVIYGDHDARINKKDYERLNNYNPYTDTVLKEGDIGYKIYDTYDYEIDRSVPFIIWTKDKQYNKVVDTTMGMYDVLPTLGNMLGIKSDYALGKDVMNLKDNTVVFPNGNFITNTMYYNNSKQEYKSLSNDPISEEYINTNVEYANTLLTVSNAIVKFDLIKKQRLYNILKEGV